VKLARAWSGEHAALLLSLGLLLLADFVLIAISLVRH